jgi:excisionase family DNA binding protein
MYLTTNEALEYMGISRETLRKLIKSGELRASKVGDGRNSPIRISKDAIKDYMDRHAVQPRP